MSLDALAKLARETLARATAPPDPDAPRRCWLVTQPSGEVWSVTLTPPATRREVEDWYPGALIEVEDGDELAPRGNLAEQWRSLAE